VRWEIRVFDPNALLISLCRRGCRTNVFADAPLNVGVSPEPGKIPIMWWDIPVNEIDFETTRSPAITNNSSTGRCPSRTVMPFLESSLADRAIIRKPREWSEQASLFGGGVVIKLGDEVIGSIGAAGAPAAKLDDSCAHAGLDKIRDRLEWRSGLPSPKVPSTLGTTLSSQEHT
jgi:hypothetical protein